MIDLGVDYSLVWLLSCAASLLESRNGVGIEVRLGFQTVLGAEFMVFQHIVVIFGLLFFGKRDRKIMAIGSYSDQTSTSKVRNI